jgi:hypothetical protein
MLERTEEMFRAEKLKNIRLEVREPSRFDSRLPDHLTGPKRREQSGNDALAGRTGIRVLLDMS